MSGPSQRDLLRECNDKQAPLDDFQTGFCSRCINPECTRSLYGQSRFDLRVNTWEDRLFKNVPKMDSQDPRFQPIAGKKFLTIDTGRTPEVRTSSWADPRDLQDEPANRPTPPVTPQGMPMVPVAVMDLTPSPTESPLQEAPQAQPRSPGRVPTHLLLSNTLSRQGQMIGGQPEAAAPRDPWATPEPPKDPVVPVGSRVKMGEPGV